MSMRIEGTRPATELESTAPAASFVAASPEAVIARAALQLEESAERAREGEQAQRRLRSQARRAEIADRKKAARLELAATCIQAAGKAASGASNMAGAGGSDGQRSLAQGRGDLFEAAGDIGGGVARLYAAKANAEAETHGLAADEAADRLEEHRASREQLTRLSERALDHIAQISDAKHQAAMAALRG